jgi:hypothetical protein
LASITTSDKRRNQKASTGHTSQLQERALLHVHKDGDFPEPM